MRTTSKSASGAFFSEDRVYRYALWRNWRYYLPPMIVIGLNPSTADETVDDPTIRRCIGFAKREGCGMLKVLNLFAFRATDPRVLLKASDPVGPQNDEFLVSHCSEREAIIVAAWGAGGSIRNRARDVLALDLPRMLCFGKTLKGEPKHPLYLSKSEPLVAF